MKVLKKMKLGKLRSRSAITLSDTEIFGRDMETRTHPEGIYDVIDDFVSSYYLNQKGDFVLLKVSKGSENAASPPTLPRKNIHSNPPERPPSHPCMVKCKCITSL